MSGFQASVASFEKQAQARFEKIRRAICLKLFTAIIRDTPVDTGRLRGNWQTTTGNPGEQALDTLDKSGAVAIAQILPNLGDGTGKDVIVYFANNLPYAYGIEFEGRSTHNDRKGMVRKNVARIQSLVNKAIQEGKI